MALLKAVSNCEPLQAITCYSRALDVPVGGADLLGEHSAHEGCTFELFILTYALFIRVSTNKRQK